MRTLAIVALVSVAGCTVDDRTNTSGVVEGTDAAPARELNVQLRVVGEDGNPVELNRFATKTDVYLTVNVSDASKPVVAEDLTYEVTDSTGKLLSSDPPACRRFHVNERGEIDNAAICEHTIAHLDEGKILIGVAPFGDAMKLSLAIEASDGERISVPFSVE
jgi:hypothetical protein